MASPQGIRAGAAFIELYAKDNRLVRGLASAQKRLQAFGASVRAIGLKMFATGALVAGPLSLAVQAASDMEETMNKFNVVFGDNAAAMKAWADQFAGEIGRSKQQIADFLAGTQDLLVPIGFDAAGAEEMSKQLTALAVDLASFNNLADADVLRDLHAALTGSGEVMKKYGVIVSEAAVKQELLNQGIDPKAVTEQQKVMARMAIILRGTTAAQGDALRSAGSLANQMKALKAKVSDAAVEIGTALLPVVTPLVTQIAEGVKVVAQWIKENQQLVVTVAKVAAAVVAGGAALVVLGTLIGGVASALGVVAGVITGVGTAIGVLGSILAALLSPIGLVVTGVVALGGYLVYASGAGGQALEWLAGRFAALKADALAAFGGIGDALAAGDLALAGKILWLSLKLEWQKGVNFLSQAWTRFKTVFLQVGTEAFYGLAIVFNNVLAGLEVAWVESTSFLANAWTRFTGWVTKGWNSAVGFLKKTWTRFKGLFDESIDVEAEVQRIDQEVTEHNAARQQETEEMLARREDERAARRQSIERDRAGAETELVRGADEVNARRAADAQADIDASEQALGAARREWLEAIETAAKKRQESEEPSSAEGPAEFQTPDITGVFDDLEGSLAGAEQRTLDVQGTFSAAAIGGLAAGGPTDRIAKATEETAHGVQRLVRHADHGGLVFE